MTCCSPPQRDGPPAYRFSENLSAGHRFLGRTLNVKCSSPWGDHPLAELGR
jgi:hypothetical protein